MRAGEERRLPGAAAQFAAVFRAEVRQELRSRRMLAAMGLYAAAVLFVLAVAFSRANDADAVAGGLVWVVVVFAALLGMASAAARGAECGAAEGLLLAPVDRGTVYLARAAACLVTVCLVEAVALPLLLALFPPGSDPAPAYPAFALAVLAGTAGIVSVGTFLAGIAAAARRGDALLAALAVPVLFPLLYACVAAASAALAGDVCASGPFGLGMAGAIGYDVVFTAIAWGLSDLVSG